MKYFKFIIPLVFLITSCNSLPDFTQKTPSLSDINDLAFSADHAKIYSERRDELLSKTGNGTIILQSDYVYNGGRHEYKNIGVRIEDDVHITENGYIVLSEKIPKEPEEIENMIRSRRY